MSKKVTIPADLREELAGANGDPVVLCDEAGNVVGYAVTAARFARLTPKPEDPWTDEEIARLEEERKNDPRPDVPHEDVLRWFERQ
ncbi:MAG: hypothetical protein C0501_04190 [Isosphaera sp.]|nr:hypothetical protein [Isosphaera sp.]